MKRYQVPLRNMSLAVRAVLLRALGRMRFRALVPADWTASLSEALGTHGKRHDHDRTWCSCRTTAAASLSGTYITGDMRRIPRRAIPFVVFLALQFNALGGGVACLLATATGQAGVVDATMANMDMPANPRDTPTPRQMPCHPSGAPQSACQSMTQCATIFAVVPPEIQVADDSAPAGRIALVAVVPSSRSLSPDVPPPKA
jgi:hypothetical protein